MSALISARTTDAFGELDVVRLRSLVDTGGGRIDPGATGTIVHRHAGTDAYEVEFIEPFPAVVTLRASDLSPAA